MLEYIIEEVQTTYVGEPVVFIYAVQLLHRSEFAKDEFNTRMSVAHQLNTKDTRLEIHNGFTGEKKYVDLQTVLANFADLDHDEYAPATFFRYQPPEDGNNLTADMIRAEQQRLGLPYILQ